LWIFLVEWRNGRRQGGVWRGQALDEKPFLEVGEKETDKMCVVRVPMIISIHF
jgi:hypothetical protein